MSKYEEAIENAINDALFLEELEGKASFNRKNKEDLDELLELQKLVIEYFGSDEPNFIASNERVLQKIVAERMIRALLKGEEEHVEAQADIFNHD